MMTDLGFLSELRLRGKHLCGQNVESPGFTDVFPHHLSIRIDLVLGAATLMDDFPKFIFKYCVSSQKIRKQDCDEVIWSTGNSVVE